MKRKKLCLQYMWHDKYIYSEPLMDEYTNTNPKGHSTACILTHFTYTHRKGWIRVFFFCFFPVGHFQCFFLERLKPSGQPLSERLNTNIAGCYKTCFCCCFHLPQQLEHYDCIKTVAFVIEKSIPNLLQWSHQPLCLSLCECMNCYWRAQQPPILHLDIKGHMKDKEPKTVPI